MSVKQSMIQANTQTPTEAAKAAKMAVKEAENPVNPGRSVYIIPTRAMKL